MTFELLIRKADLERAVAHRRQTELYRLCGPATEPLIADHLDVVRGAVTSALSGAGGLSIRVPVDLFLVSEADIAAAANDIRPKPKGADAATGRLVATYDVAIAGTRLTFRALPLESEPPLPGLDDLLVGIPVPALPDADLKQMLDALRLPGAEIGVLDLLGAGEIGHGIVVPAASGRHESTLSTARCRCAAGGPRV